MFGCSKSELKARIMKTYINAYISIYNIVEMNEGNFLDVS